MKKNVFISYNHTGGASEAVDQLSGKLQDMGLNVWLDRNEIKPGESISSAISSGLDQASYVVAVVGPEDKQSVWAQKELEIAKAKGKPIIPVTINNATAQDLPELISDYMAVDATNLADLRKVYDVIDTERGLWSRLKEYIINDVIL